MSQLIQATYKGTNGVLDYEQGRRYVLQVKAGDWWSGKAIKVRRLDINSWLRYPTLLTFLQDWTQVRKL